MKKLFLFITCALYGTIILAQNSVKEDFEANSFEWTEYTYSNNYYAEILKGFLKISSSPIGYTGAFGGSDVAAVLLQEAAYPSPAPTHKFRMSESHCVAPIDVQKPFIIRSWLKSVVQLNSSNCIGILFNYRDAANYYCIALNLNGVRFSRYENGKLVGFEECPMVPKKVNNVMMNWELKKDGDYIIFTIDEIEFLKIKYAPLEYRGFGYFAYDGATIWVDEVEFIR